MQASISNVSANASAWPERSVQRWRTLFWLMWALVLVVKIALAASLAPFGDEAWYWQESRHLAWSYSDLPLATAWLIQAGEFALGHSTLAMRAPFLLLGALLPLIMLRLGRRVFGAGPGYCAGLLTLTLPLLGTLGVLALPDVPLTFASALALDAFEGAARTRRMRYWALLGVALALAWLSHYRAVMLLLAGLAFLCVTARGRSLWRESGLWLALGLACIGLIPLLVFNFQQHWVALDFQLLQRNPWSFHADALVQPLEQALVCTPLFYALLLWALWRALRRRRDGSPWDLFAICAAVPLAAYFVFGLFADDTRFRVHWPLPGYLPLLLILPVLLHENFRRARRIFVVAAFVVLVTGEVIAFAYLVLAAVPGAATALAQTKAFPGNFVGWHEAATETRMLLAQPRFADAALAADNFMLAAELDFALDGTRPVYSLDSPLNVKHGRAPQLMLWNRDQAGLHRLGVRHPVLLVAEPTAHQERDRAQWMDSLCARIANLTPVAALDAYAGRKRYRWFSGTIPASGVSAPANCAATDP